LAFSFWLFFGLLVLNFEKISEKKISFEKIPELGLIFNSFSILIFVFFVFIFYFAIRFYLADHNYSKAVRTGNPAEQVSLLEKAVKLNPIFSQYRIDLARANLSGVLLEIQKPAEQQDQNLISNSVAMAINYLKGARFEDGTEIKGATEISPNWVGTWENLGIVYREIIPLTQGQSMDWAIKSFERAEKLEPKNPILETEIAKLYIEKGNLDKAEEKLKFALNLNPWYIEGNFQLGRVYFNKGKVDEAISQFENVISLMPNHSNSLYSLGLCYEKKGEKEKALGYFRRVLDLNPGNPDVLQKIQELEK
jgi:tetratricopeptide (TPR) repeat protein